MNFRQRNKNFLIKDNPSKKFFVQIIFVVLIFIIVSLPWTRNILFSMGSPLWTAKNNINSFFVDNAEVLNSKTNLLKENDLLNAQIKSEAKDHALFTILENENEDLKNILNRKKEDQKILLGAILVKPFLSPYDTLVIDVGLSDGVTVGDQVLVNGDTFIGYVSEVYDNTSKVVLYSSPGEKTKVLIGNSDIEKEAIGLGDGNFEVETPREIDVKEGDSITIPSISTNIFGIVEKIEFKESDSFQNVLFKNPVNIAELKWVEVLLPNKK
jgi:cell shape-determining protein MreC